jgi:Zn-dependent M28 family amino/carboxypeptidase
VPQFSADSAHALLRRQVEFGPRVAGTEGHAAQLAWMAQRLAAAADTLVRQDFRHVVEGDTLRMTNLFARFAADNAERILLVAHWDTRPTADSETSAERRAQPIPGANDGASGTAVLLHLADILAANPPPIGVDILLVDGEDYGPYENNMYLGAKHFAANHPEGYMPLYGILLDMIGDLDPVYPIEGNSQSYAPEVVERVWRLAEQLGYSDLFVRRQGISISDDHIPLNRAGFRTIDIIDFDYGPGNRYWHTLGDTVEHTSPRGLGAVGTVVTTLIYKGG